MKSCFRVPVFVVLLIGIWSVAATAKDADQKSSSNAEGSALGTDVDETNEVAKIKKEFSAIEKARKRLRKKTRDDNTLSLEGGNITTFQDAQKRLRLIESELYGESYRVKESFYFYETGELFFVFSRHTQYPCPPEAAEEYGCGEPTLTETRLYLTEDGAPVRMLVDTNGKRESIDRASETVRERVREADQMARKLGWNPKRKAAVK